MTARICGRALNYPVVAARQAIDMALQGDDTHVVIQADIASPGAWALSTRPTYWLPLLGQAQGLAKASAAPKTESSLTCCSRVLVAECVC